MAEICPRCGLPKELCVCETIAKEQQKIIVKTIKKKFAKINTEDEGTDEKEIKLRDLEKNRKNKVKCEETTKKAKTKMGCIE